MTAGEIMAAVAFGVTVFGALTGAFWRVYGLIKDASNEGKEAKRELAAHKLHVAETYVTKAGLNEQTNQILKSIEGVGSRIDGLHERIDRVLEQRSTRSRS